MIREKSAVDCDGSCFKWQQVLNNSGILFLIQKQFKTLNFLFAICFRIPTLKATLTYSR
jgi:hypothetical protein